MNVITIGKVPIKMWSDEYDDKALEQAKNLANLPFVHKHVALMPDYHAGYGMPIGGVVACDNVVIPNAVGVDIGCGMQTAKTSLKVSDLKDLPAIRDAILEEIPVGRNWRNEPENKMVNNLPDKKGYVARCESENIPYQLGTLGGGNHFIEIQADEEENVWIMVHSGSRNLGKKVAEYYNNKAEELNEIFCTSVPESWKLAYLPMQLREAQEYMCEMDYCVEFAKLNREKILFTVAEILLNPFKGAIREWYDVAHNYASVEKHYGKNVVVHRKGATRALKGEIGIIPGSQGTSSYIVEGLGNPMSFMSCSHGAGRRMSRRRAKDELDLEVEIGKMEGIVHGIRGVGDLDEAPSAYKDIDVVMENQKDLVKPIVKLRPILVIKG